MSRIMHNRVDYKKIFSTIFLFIFIIVLIVAIFFAVQSIQFTDKVLKGVSVNGIDLSGLTEEEATARMDEYKEKLLNDTDYSFEYSNNTYKVSGKDLGLDFSGDVVTPAMEYGKNDNFFDNMSYLVKSITGSEVNLSGVSSDPDEPTIVSYKNSYDRCVVEVNGKLITQQKVNRIFATTDTKYGKMYKVKIDKNGNEQLEKVQNSFEHNLVFNESLTKFDKKLLDLDYYINLCVDKLKG